MVNILSDVIELSDLISQSDEVKHYIDAREKMLDDIDTMHFIQQFQKVKEDYEEAQRFGIFHPNYHEAKEKAQLFQKEMYERPFIRDFLEAEKHLDEILYEVSILIAHSVSESVMVPNSRWNTMKKGCKCK